METVHLIMSKQPIDVSIVPTDNEGFVVVVTGLSAEEWNQIPVEVQRALILNVVRREQWNFKNRIDAFTDALDRALRHG
jgi:hypothetical protein